MRTTIFNLILATVYDFTIAIMPYWHKSDSESLYGRFIEIGRYIQNDLNMYFDITLDIFILPAFAGLTTILTLIILFFTKENYRISRNVVLAPIIIVLCILLYELITRRDIHIVGISLIALIPAWLSYRKHHSASP